MSFLLLPPFLMGSVLKGMSLSLKEQSPLLSSRSFFA